MFERAEKWLKIFCLLLAALLMYRVAAFAFHGNPLANLKIPSVPSLPVTNASTTTNPVTSKSTNSAARGETTKTGTNTSSTNVATAKTIGANLAQTNLVTVTNANGTNIAASIAKSTNATNSVTTNASTNSPGGIVAVKPGGDAMPGPGVRGARRGGPMEPGKLGPEVPLAVRSRVEKIVASEIFGPVMRPLPMALLGIGDNEAFMRAPNGQTGLMKEGDEMGGVKMLRIGTNRVLVDQDGQSKELMIFGGIGSETLMPKKETTNEPTRKLP